MRKKPTSSERISHLLSRNVEQVIERNHLEAALKSGRKLRVKLGIDPTGGNVHIGHAVTYWKLREFQDLGHKIIIIIGDFTAQIGDPSDKLAKRPFLTRTQIKQNLKNYLPQIGRIVNLKKAEIHYNGEWLAKLNFREISELAEVFTVQQMLERKNFAERLSNQQEISLRETLYPLMQGYDSVAVRADVELGGTDQLFNLLAGRKIQERYGQKPQDVMLMSMLIGTDGRKMSKTWGNVINIADPAQEMYGRVMAMHDNQIPNYFRLATDVAEEKIRDYEKMLQDQDANPKIIKMALALEIVARYHGAPAAAAAAEKWTQLFSAKNISAAELPTLKLKTKRMAAVDLVLAAAGAQSRGEAFRLIQQGGLKVNSAVLKDPRALLELKSGDVVKVGKKKFFRVK